MYTNKYNFLSSNGEKRNIHIRLAIKRYIDRYIDFKTLPESQADKNILVFSIFVSFIYIYIFIFLIFKFKGD